MKLCLATLVLVVLEVRAHAGPSAEALYDEGQRAYENGAFATAVAKWKQSYELSGAPGLLFNVAQALRLGGDCAGALSTYRRFVEIDPTADQRVLADDFVRELEPKCGARPQTPSVERPRTNPGQTLKTAGLVTGGGGVVLVVTGLLFGRHAKALGDEVSKACLQECDWAAQRDKDATGRRYTGIGYGLDGLGIAAVVAGGVMYYVGQRESAVTVTPRPREGGATVTWSVCW